MKKSVVRKSIMILNALAFRGPRIARQLERELRIDHDTVHECVRLLGRAGAIDYVDEGRPKAQNRKEMKINGRGVLVLLQAHGKYVNLSRRRIRKLAKMQTAFLPLILGKWDYFRERQVEDIAYEFLLRAVKETGNEVDHLERICNGDNITWSSWLQEPIHRHDIYEFMFLRAWNDWYSFYAELSLKDPAEAWLDALRSDKELSDISQKEIELLTQDLKGELRSYNNCLGYFKGESRKPWIPAIQKQSQSWKEFKGIVRYERTKALDEGKAPPSEEEVIYSFRRIDAHEPY